MSDEKRHCPCCPGRCSVPLGTFPQECPGLPPCEKCAAQEAKATSAWNMWNVACHDIGRLQEDVTRLTARLAEVTKQNEEAQVCAMENLGRFLCLAKQCPTATIPTQTERVLATMQATNAQFVKMRDELAEVTKERDAARQGEFRSAAAWKVAVAERDTLRAALRQCGEAMKEAAKCRALRVSCSQCMADIHEALDLPTVRAVMED